MQSTFNRSHTATLGTFRCCRTLPTRAGRYRRTPPCPASARNPGRCNSLLGGDSRCCAVAAWPVCCPRHPVPSRHSLQHPCHAKVVWAAGLSGLGCERRRGAEHVTETLVSPASYSCPAYHSMCGSGPLWFFNGSHLFVRIVDMAHHASRYATVGDAEFQVRSSSGDWLGDGMSATRLDLVFLMSSWCSASMLGSPAPALRFLTRTACR